jgi:hypothetical protein
MTCSIVWSIQRSYLLGSHKFKFDYADGINRNDRAYFCLAETPKIFRGLDEWIRHRLRAYQLKQWKRGRTVFRALRARGMSVDSAARVAANARRWWHNSRLLLHSALPNSYLAELGLPSLGP